MTSVEAGRPLTDQPDRPPRWSGATVAFAAGAFGGGLLLSLHPDAGRAGLEELGLWTCAGLLHLRGLCALRIRPGNSPHILRPMAIRALLAAVGFVTVGLARSLADFETYETLDTLFLATDFILFPAFLPFSVAIAAASDRRSGFLIGETALLFVWALPILTPGANC